MKKIILLISFVSIYLAGFSTVRTWTGAVDDRWDRNTNWSPAGVPGNGDIVILDGTGINRAITRFNATQLAQLVVSNASGNVTYSISSFGDGVLGITGASGTDLDIQSGCSLTIIDHVLFTLDGVCTANIDGDLTFNEGFSGHLITFAANSTTTLTGNLIFTGTGTGGTIDIQYGALIEGDGSVTHTLGAMTVNGLIEIEGDVNNDAPVTGTGTIKTGGNFNNTSTMFSYPGNPPGEIISGYTWRGLTGTAWETGSNWWAGAVPVSTGDAVIYPAGNLPVVTVTAQACRRLYIYDENSLVTIAPSGQLTATGKTTLITDDGTPGSIALLIKSDVTGTGSFIDNGVFDGFGIVSMERFLEYGATGQWHFICVPMTQINAFTYFDQYLKYYQEATHHYKYVIAPGDSILNSDGLGYAIWPNLTDYLAEQNGIPNTGTMIVPVSRSYDNATGDFDGWNLVGNPYTSAVDLALLTTGWNNTDATAWFWDGNAGNFKVYPSGGAGSHSQYCPAGQAFFVHCNDLTATPSSPGSGFIVMNNAGRVHNTETFLKTSEPDILKITAHGAPNDFNDELSIRFGDGLTEGYDPGFDAKKLSGDPSAPQIFTKSGGNDLAVNALPSPEAGSVIPMSFTSALTGSYVLTASETESFPMTTGILLDDLLTGVTQDLRSQPEYFFTHKPGNDPARFLIRFVDGSVGGKEPLPGNNLVIYTSDRSVIVANGNGSAGNVFVYDLLGRTVANRASDSSPVIRVEVPGAKGYYVVRVVSGDRTTIRKVYLN